jgi:hypothetical protein
MVLTREILLKNEMRRAGHVAGVGKKKVAHRVLMSTPENNESARRQWDNNVTLKCFLITIVAVEKQKLLHVLSVCL